MYDLPKRLVESETWNCHNVQQVIVCREAEVITLDHA